MNRPSSTSERVSGEFLTLGDERYYAIRNVDRMAPFFISVVSDSDHWLFISSSGGLTAGRVSPETALFPYVTVDKVHESTPHTGTLTIIRCEREGELVDWEPFNRAHDGRFSVTRSLYKNVLGDKLSFEEINHDLQLCFRWTWMTSETYGFVRRCELNNLGSAARSVELVDGLQNLLPAGTPRHSQANASNLVNAYKWNELFEAEGLALYTLYAGVSDRAEPCESLRATTVFCLGLEGHRILLSGTQLEGFRRGHPVEQERLTRGVRGVYLVNVSLDLQPNAARTWQFVADVEESQAEVVSLRRELHDPDAVARRLDQSVREGTDALARIMAGGDAFQTSAEETISAHHYANVLFNILRGGTFDEQYRVTARYFRRALKTFNRPLCETHRAALEALPDETDYGDLLTAVERLGDPQLERLTREYLPIDFGRRHGDPSRPWNQFAIRTKDERGDKLLVYQGNWRDIFQNWEALTFSFPEFIENVIAKFLNASTADGYNPYRISNEGIDWEVEDPEDPWSYIGYWGDHQIVYLLRMLELSDRFHPGRLGGLLDRPVFAYANVPYRIKPFDRILEDAKDTVVYDQELARRIETRVADLGADGKLLLDGQGRVYQVNLLEKLIVPLLAKLGNLVLDGGIWLNTQRPEWNDANNALVGHGLSMVTLYYMRRYVDFLHRLIASESGSVSVSAEVGRWLRETLEALQGVRSELGDGPARPEVRYRLLVELGQAAGRYREALYAREGFSSVVPVSFGEVRDTLREALAAIDHSIAQSEREDGLREAYNVVELNENQIEVDHLDPMLEGQVAALSSGAISPSQAADLVDALFASDVYRSDARTFMLYPDRDLPSFLEKNRIPSDAIEGNAALRGLLEADELRVVVRDDEGRYRFAPDLQNASALRDVLDQLEEEFGDQAKRWRKPVLALYEEVFRHRAFTGRAGTMFGFEGLGSVYWHMVSKLLLAVQEVFFDALASDADEATCHRLGALYYRIRKGLGFNKTPSEYGAFPTDPYSHTPKHTGAQQPGMTGQVKEEVLTRFGELGLRVHRGQVSFELRLLRAREFTDNPSSLRYLDVEGRWEELEVPSSALAFTWCQVPFLYRLDDSVEPSVTVTDAAGKTTTLLGLSLPEGLSAELFRRSGAIRKVELVLNRKILLPGSSEAKT